MPDLNVIRIQQEDQTLAEIFRQNGFATFGFSENPYISESKGFDQGFDQFTYYRATIPGTSDAPELRDHSATDAIFERAREAIGMAQDKDQPWFGYIHMLRPHEPLLAPSPHGTQFMNKNVPASEALEKRILQKIRRGGQAVKRAELQYVIDSYDGNLAYADYKIGEFLDWLREENLFEDTVIVIASDHGEAFLQHGLYGHGLAVFEEFIHVPLIFRVPEPVGVQPGVSMEIAEMVDVVPTLVEIFGLDTSETLHGRSLLSEMRGQPLAPKPATFAQALGTYLLSVRIGNLKMICAFDPNTRELSDAGYYDPRTNTFSRFAIFDLDKDPGEQKNIYTGDYPVDEFVAAATEYLARWPIDLDFSDTDDHDELRDDLEAIGYLGN